MNQKKYRCLAALLALLFTVCTGCAAVKSADKTEKQAKRVVALSAAECEIAYALGAGELLVGRGEYCDFPAEAQTLPAVSSGAVTNLEQILALSPDVVLMSSMDQPKEQVAQLENAGVQVVVDQAEDIAGVYDAIRAVGTALEKPQEAEELIAQMNASFSSLSADPALAGKTVYFEVSPLEYGLWAAGGGTFMNEIAEMLGLRNIFSDLDGWAEVSEEQVIERDPDYIVTVSMSYDGSQAAVEEILSRPGWQSMRAVQSAAVLHLTDDSLTRPGPRLTAGAKKLYEFVKAN